MSRTLPGGLSSPTSVSGGGGATTQQTTQQEPAPLPTSGRTAPPTTSGVASAKLGATDPMAPAPAPAPIQQAQQAPQLQTQNLGVPTESLQTGTRYGMIPNQQQSMDGQQAGAQQSFSMAGDVQQFMGDVMDTPVPWGMYGETPQEVLDFLGNFGPGGEGMPGALGAMLTQFTDLYKGLEGQWNADMGSTPEASPYIANLLQNFQYNPGSLTGDVAQNWTNAMDSSAWEQRADNLMAAQRENLLGGLNEAERRARGAAARGGYSPAAGLGNAYNNYSQGLTQATRDIYNDSLQQQMNALQGASSYALGSEAQDRALYNQALGMMNQAGMYDAVNRADQHTNFGEFAGGVLGAGAAALGGMNEFAGNLLGGLGGGGGASLIGLLPMLAGGPPIPM